MMTLFRSLVQSHLDYCVKLWYPHQISEMQKLETIQRSFTSKIPALEGMDYWIRLSFLGLFSVQRRYEHLFKEKLDKYLFTIDDEPSVPG